VQGVPRELHEERLAGPAARVHEGLGSPGHAEDVHGVRIGEVVGVLVARIAVVLVVAVPTGAAAGEVPLAVVGGGIARPFQEFADRDLGGGDLLREHGLDEPVARFGWGGLRPMEAGGALAGLEADSRRGADRRRGVGVREPHALRREPLDIRRLDEVAPGAEHVGMHGDRESVPALVVGEQEDDVRPRAGWGGRAGKRRGRGRREREAQPEPEGAIHGPTGCGRRPPGPRAPPAMDGATKATRAMAAEGKPLRMTGRPAIAVTQEDADMSVERPRPWWDSAGVPGFPRDDSAFVKQFHICGETDPSFSEIIRMFGETIRRNGEMAASRAGAVIGRKSAFLP